jgi:N-dimethylarginine dimethylaminohydrolase
VHISKTAKLVSGELDPGHIKICNTSAKQTKNANKKNKNRVRQQHNRYTQAYNNRTVLMRQIMQ